MTDSQEAAIKKRMLVVFRQHAKKIAAISAKGLVAGVVIEPLPIVGALAKGLGYTGSPVFEVDPTIGELYAQSLERDIDDKVAAAWFRRSGSKCIRIFALVHGGTLLVNCTAEGYSFEPGSTDTEINSRLH